MLEWLHHDNIVQNQDGHGYINENGLRSQLGTQFPLKQNQGHRNSGSRKR